MTDFEPIIAKFRSIGHIPDDQINMLLPSLSFKHYPKGDFFVRAGELTSMVGFIVSGIVKFCYTKPDGREYTRFFCREGSFASVFIALATGQPSPYSIKILQDTDMILMPYSAWHELIKKSSCWAAIDRKMLIHAHVLSQHRDASLILDDAYTRYLALLEEFPGIEMYVKQYDIASYLGITPVSLSRMRRLKKTP